ncbi:MAG: ATP-binding cassette domain-containing protein [Sphaerobacter sp.]|nr:ATP-binding cassette domain-containing protein [Sphaerobacter sp.]
MTVAARTPILELHGIAKRFGAVQALVEVDFEVYAGEVVALVGDNGAGKSTLIKIVAGTYRADAGVYRFAGDAVTVARPSDATHLGIETVYQDLALCDNLDVVANLFLGREQVDALLPGIVRPLSEVEMERRAVEVLSSLGVRIPSVRSPVATLSGGQRQAVAIARAVMWNSKVVILDEPTAALGVAQTRQVLNLIRRLRDRGLGVVVVSHNLADIFEVADRIIVLRLGRRIATFDRHTTTPEAVVGAITGAGLELPDDRRLTGAAPDGEETA